MGWARPMAIAVTLTGFLQGAVIALCLVAMVGIVVALLTDDRDPTTVIAWLLVVTLVPFVGVILYFFIGRNYRRETPLRRRVLGEIEDEAAHVLSPIYETYGAFTAEARASLAGTSSRKLAAMSERAGGTPILPAGSVDLFTSGAEKFGSLEQCHDEGVTDRLERRGDTGMQDLDRHCRFNPALSRLRQVSERSPVSDREVPVI